jgi:DNA replication protein DnaC
MQRIRADEAVLGTHADPIAVEDLALLRQVVPLATLGEAPVPPKAEAAPCLTCRGAGYYTFDVTYPHPQFGVLQICACRQRERTQRLVEQCATQAGIPDLTERTFNAFDPNIPGVRRAWVRCQEYARSPHGFLTLLGNYGSGKTHLAAAIVNVVLANSAPALISTVPDLLDYLRATFRPQAEENYDSRFEFLRTVELLVLDDLGTEGATPWAREKLYQLINHRYNARLATVVTSNQPKGSVDGRIVSRLNSGEVLHIEAADYRLRAQRHPWK